MDTPRNSQSNGRDFAADIRRHVDDFLIPKYTKDMPFRLIDTYTGLILELSEIVALLKIRRDYAKLLQEVVDEAEELSILIGTEARTERPNLDLLDAFLAEYFAFAMFSHRWRGVEPTLQDVRKSRGVYCLRPGDLERKNPQAFQFPKKPDAFLSGVEKLQEFCCTAAKCGFRWAWGDMCCIDKTDYAETSESINCMFLWYRSSYLTIVYLDDVDDVKEGRLSGVNELQDSRWFENAELRSPLPAPPSTPLSPASPTSPTPSFPRPESASAIYDGTLQTSNFYSLYDRISKPTASYPKLRSMHFDSQVDTPQLKCHIDANFPGEEDSEHRGIYRSLPVWVTRGWTLQEMVASRRLRFYSKRWTLLEEAEDRYTDDAEDTFFIPAFRYRARLVDHRDNHIWSKALYNTTGIPKEDLVNFKPGTGQVRTRLLWAAKRTTTKIEDMAYCLLGIFDVSLPAMYGEGHRAFFRLQEELMKRTGDVSLFDWCGRSSHVNSFLAHSPGCFIARDLPAPLLDDTSDSLFWMVVKVLCRFLGTVWTGVKAAAEMLMERIKDIMKSPPPGYSLINGELNLSIFEHQVHKCEFLEELSSTGKYYYQLTAHGLTPTTIILSSHSSYLLDNPKQYYLCRAWDRYTQNVFEILGDFVRYLFQDAIGEILNKLTNGGESDECECDNTTKDAEEDLDPAEQKLRAEMRRKREDVLAFFGSPFPAYLVLVEDHRRVRLSTMDRVEASYPEAKFDFTLPVVTRSIM